MGITTYTVSFPVKPYIKKYVTTIEGSPLQFKSSSMLCMIIRAYMENKNSYIQLSEKRINNHLNFRTATINVVVPLVYQYQVGTILRPEGIVLINRFLEDIFERALTKFIHDNIKAGGRYKGFKEAYFAFADMYNIELEEDITYDGLKKIDFRYRKSLKKNKNFFVESVLSIS